MQLPDLYKFTIEACDGVPGVLLGDGALDVVDVSDNGQVIVECDQREISRASLDGFPKGLTIQIHSRDGFGTFLFHEAAICGGTENGVVAEYVCHQANKYWEGTWGLSTFLCAIRNQLAFHPEVKLGEIELDDDWKRLTLRVPLGTASAIEALQEGALILKRMMAEAEIALGGIQWKPEYAKQERLFCEEVLAPLLRRMRFLSVRYMQGTREYGKDFTFSEMTSFGVMRHYGLQAKAGDISGEVNSAVDELVGQVDDAFAMPYVEISASEPRYISTFIIAISGHFTANAKEKILHKIPRGRHGLLLFLDREAIIELVERFWKAR